MRWDISNENRKNDPVIKLGRGNKSQNLESIMANGKEV